nr:hypothetical protein [Paguma larvata torque teno virus]
MDTVNDYSSGLLDTNLLQPTPCSSPTSWNRELERKKLHEAIWKQSCSRTHSLWCSCGNWTSHIRICGTGTDAPGGDTGGGVTGPGDVDFDAGLEFEDEPAELR